MWEKNIINGEWIQPCGKFLILGSSGEVYAVLSKFAFVGEFAVKNKNMDFIKGGQGHVDGFF